MKANNVFGKRSKEVLVTLHLDLKKILTMAIAVSAVDFGLHEGARTLQKQQEYFDAGKSKLNPSKHTSIRMFLEKAKHIVEPGIAGYELSRAVDFHVSEKHGGKSLAWDEMHLMYVVGVMQTCAKILYESGEIEHLIRSGGDWDKDGVFKYDQRFQDLNHVELYKPEVNG